MKDMTGNQKSLELHDTVDTTVETEINHVGIIKEQIANETKFMEDHIRSKVDHYKKYNAVGIFISVSMMFYVIQKTIFNCFASIDLQYDIWSKVDMLCAIVDITVLCFF